MITLSQKQQIIISAYLEGKSFREIARQTGIDRGTVTKYAKKYEEDRQNEGDKVAAHDRKFDFNEWSIKIEYFLHTLKKKLGALDTSMALHQANPRLQQIYTEYFIKKEREFIASSFLAIVPGSTRVLTN